MDEEMRETTMTRNSKYIAMALGAAVLLAGCSAKSPTAPKPTPIPAFTISLTPEASSAKAGEYVLVVAQVKSGSANAPDGTAVTFDITSYDQAGDLVGSTEAVRTTSAGGTSVTVTSSGGTVVILGRVPGGSDQTTVTFTGIAPTPTPTPTPTDQPQIYALTPNAGPFEGGTRVTISGVGFQAPVQVLFDDIQAQVVSTSYREVVCISPSITPTAPPTVVTKQVTVTNIGNGKKSNGVGFRYGVTMFISAIVPPDGPQDTATTVTIFGQGFVAPVTVTITGVTGVTSWDVLSVAGTEIVAKTKPLPEDPRTCGNFTATVTVTNVDSGAQSNPTGQFTYQAVHPLITSVQIDSGTNTVQQYVPVAVPPSVAVCSTPWGNHRVTIRGSGFQQGMTVNFDGLAPVPTTFVDATTLTLAQLPDLTSVSLERISCTTGAGACGNRFIPTQVGITVNNPRNGCSDTLNNAVVINPCDNSCLVTSVASLSFSTNPPASATVGTPFNIQLGFTPSPLTVPTTVSFNYVGFTANPSSVPISGTSPSVPISVTPTGAGSGFIIASVGSGSCAVTATSTAVTVNPLTFGLTVTKSGNVAGGDITSLPLGLLSCLGATTPCTGTFNDGTLVTLTASTVANWSGSCAPSGANPTASATVTMDAVKSCNAAFP
jgi:hypothetical protein